MARFYGKIGYAKTVETTPGVWEQQITERDYFGDVLQFGRRLEGGSEVNDNINVNNRFSIVADPFAYENFYAMQYICWMDVKWKITNVEVQYPRLILTIGGVYNESQSPITGDSGIGGGTGY